MPLYSDMGQNSRARFVIFQSEADQGVHLPYDLDITFLDMERFLVTAWRLARSTVAGHWSALNSRFFGGELAPCPICIAPHRPMGTRLRKSKPLGLATPMRRSDIPRD